MSICPVVSASVFDQGRVASCFVVVLFFEERVCQCQLVLDCPVSEPLSSAALISRCVSSDVFGGDCFWFVVCSDLRVEVSAKQDASSSFCASASGARSSGFQYVLELRRRVLKSLAKAEVIHIGGGSVTVLLPKSQKTTGVQFGHFPVISCHRRFLHPAHCPLVLMKMCWNVSGNQAKRHCRRGCVQRTSHLAGSSAVCRGAVWHRSTCRLA